MKLTTDIDRFVNSISLKITDLNDRVSNRDLKTVSEAVYDSTLPDSLFFSALPLRSFKAPRK